MIGKLTPEELEFVESFYNPIAQTECLFSDFDNLTSMEGEQLSHVRLGQLPLLSYEYLIDDNPKLSEKENFRLKKAAGDIYALGGRLFGKTLCVEKLDILLNLINPTSGTKLGFSSYDAIHIRGILEDLIQALEHHPFLRLFKAIINRSPNYRIAMKGVLLEGVNMNIAGKKPGAQFFQKHFTKLWIEEASFETRQVYAQRRDSVSEDGCIFRISGMTNFTKYSPCGQVFYDITKKTFIVNLPQYVNPKWDKNEDAKAVKDFNGRQSINYRIFIKGEVVEEGVSVFDMERIRKSYNEEKIIKTFEINKKNFNNFQDIIVVERPSNATNVFLFADIGESAPSEVGIIFEINKKYRYTYNITIYNLTDKEQFKIFEWLAKQIQANFIALDCTDGTGRAIFRSLEQVFSKDNLVWVHFAEKIPVDFETDDNGNKKFKDGKPIYKEEFVVDWSIKHLKDLFYGERMEMPMDYKFDSQMNSVISMQSGKRVIYECIAQENHTFQMFQVFSILHWYCEFIIVKPIVEKTFGKSGV